MGCPKTETILEWVSIPSEMSRFQRLRLLWHTAVCRTCRGHRDQIRSSWYSTLLSEPDVTDSIIRVYSRLKHDETLCLKGWKLGQSRTNARVWLFPGAVATGVLALTLWVAIPSTPLVPTGNSAPATLSGRDTPLAQIRFEDKNRIQVHYVRPELLHSLEFETASGQ